MASYLVSFPPKLVAILCLLQFLFVTMGYLLTRSFLKFYQQVVPEMLGSRTPSIPSISNFIRVFGLWFLLVPVVWCVVAIVRGEVVRDMTSISAPQFMIGIAITIAVMVVFTFSAYSAYSVAFRGY